MERAEKPFGEFVKEIRKERGLTQKNLADVLGVTAAHISNVEKGGGVSEAFKRLFLEKMNINHFVGNAHERVLELIPETDGRFILLHEMTAARSDLGKPMDEEECVALASAEIVDILAQSMLLREALELKTDRELLKSAKINRQRWEAKAHGK